METVDGEKPLLRATSRRVTRLGVDLRPGISFEVHPQTNATPIMHGAAKICHDEPRIPLPDSAQPELRVRQLY